VGLSGTRDSAKKFEALTGTDKQKSKGETTSHAFISFVFFFSFQSQTAVNKFNTHNKG
jgi:hypothetical protein